jgi:hypothetical protein
MATSSFSKGIIIDTDEKADALLKAVKVSRKAGPFKSVDIEKCLANGHELLKRRYSK